MKIPFSNYPGIVVSTGPETVQEHSSSMTKHFPCCFVSHFLTNLSALSYKSDNVWQPFKTFSLSSSAAYNSALKSFGLTVYRNWISSSFYISFFEIVMISEIKMVNFHSFLKAFLKVNKIADSRKKIVVMCGTF